MSARLTWQGGGEAEILSISQKSIALRSTVPSPPGSRIEGTLVGAPAARVRVKIHGCRRNAEGDYLLEGRSIDLTREVREMIELATKPPAAP